MDGGEHTEIIIAGLLLAVAALVTLARVLNVPYPIFLVLGGLALGAIPGMPDIQLDPELVLLIFLPPLLYGAAFFASLRDLRRNVGPISALAVGLVLATCVHGRRRHPRRRPRHVVGGGVRARRDRLPHRPGRGDGDRGAARASRAGSSSWSRASR